MNAIEEWVVAVLSVREVLGSNLGSQTGYLEIVYL
jgi:hypothetical protein